MKTIIIDNYKIVIKMINECYKFIISLNNMIIDELLFNESEFGSFEEVEEYAIDYVSDLSFEY